MRNPNVFSIYLTHGNFHFLFQEGMNLPFEVAIIPDYDPSFKHNVDTDNDGFLYFFKRLFLSMEQWEKDCKDEDGSLINAPCLIRRAIDKKKLFVLSFCTNVIQVDAKYLKVIMKHPYLEGRKYDKRGNKYFKWDTESWSMKETTKKDYDKHCEFHLIEDEYEGDDHLEYVVYDHEVFSNVKNGEEILFTYHNDIKHEAKNRNEMREILKHLIEADNL